MLIEKYIVTLEEIITVVRDKVHAVVMNEDTSSIFFEVSGRPHIHSIAIVTEVEIVMDDVMGIGGFGFGLGGGQGFFSLEVISSCSIHFIDKIINWFVVYYD